MDTRQKQQQQEHTARINLAMDYIQAHLAEELSLAAVAKAAGFSKYHFHRVFACFCGETLNHFVKRLRVERAAFQLLGNPNKTITEIALDCGFSGSSAFARAFKEIMGISASEWRDGGAVQRKNDKTNSNICKTDGNPREAFEITMDKDGWQSTTPTWRIQMKDQLKKENDAPLNATIEVKDMPDFNVVYVRHVGAYQGDSTLFGKLIGRLCSWAGPRGLVKDDSKILMVYHDDPNITDDDKLRLDVCLAVDGDVAVSGDIGKSTIPGGKYAVGHFELDETQFSSAWSAVMGGFLSQGEYQPDERLCYEMYLNDPQTHPENKFIVDICVPVKPM